MAFSKSSRNLWLVVVVVILVNLQYISCFKVYPGDSIEEVPPESAPPNDILEELPIFVHVLYRHGDRNLLAVRLFYLNTDIIWF